MKLCYLPVGYPLIEKTISKNELEDEILKITNKIYTIIVYVETDEDIINDNTVNYYHFNGKYFEKNDKMINLSKNVVKHINNILCNSS